MLVFSIVSLVISIAAVVATVWTVVEQRENNQKNANAVFANLWFELDQLFVQQPHMHKYFYTHCTEKGAGPGKKSVAKITADSKDFDLALCIAERMVDVFQYAKLFKDSLSDADKNSYEEFKKSIFLTKFMIETVKPIWENNGSQWIFSEEEWNDMVNKWKTGNGF